MLKITLSRDQQLMVCDGKRYVFVPNPPSACPRCSIRAPGERCPLGRGPAHIASFGGEYRRFCDEAGRKDGINGCWRAADER